MGRCTFSCLPFQANSVVYPSSHFLATTQFKSLKKESCFAVEDKSQFQWIHGNHKGTHRHITDIKQVAPMTGLGNWAPKYESCLLDCFTLTTKGQHLHWPLLCTFSTQMKCPWKHKCKCCRFPGTAGLPTHGANFKRFTLKSMQFPWACSYCLYFSVLTMKCCPGLLKIWKHVLCVENIF